MFGEENINLIQPITLQEYAYKVAYLTSATETIKTDEKGKTQTNTDVQEE